MTTTTWTWNPTPSGLIEGQATLEDGTIRYLAQIDTEDGLVIFYSRQGFILGDAPASTVREGKAAAAEWVRHLHG